jgi:hypothetical protein
LYRYAHQAQLRHDRQSITSLWFSNSIRRY